MATLMISLDRNILNPRSNVANRMLALGQSDFLTIVIPDKEKKEIKLESSDPMFSRSVTVYTSGGSLKTTQFFLLWRLCKQLISKKEHYNRVTAQDPFFTGLLGRLVCAEGAEFEVQLHGDFYGSSYYKNNGFCNLIRFYLGKYLVLPRASRIRAVGERIKRSLIAIGISEAKIEVRPVDTGLRERIRIYLHARAQSKREVKVFSEKYGPIFLWAGRMESVKNLFWLIDIFHEVLKKKPMAYLCFIGDGSQKRALQNKVRELGISENVEFIGWTDEPPYVYMAHADAVLLPSLSEGYGLAVMEALAVGKDVIMTDVGVANYEVKSGPHVRIVPINDQPAFISAMLSVKKSDNVNKV